jgi:hypothetical protein
MTTTLAARIAKASKELGGALAPDKQNKQGGGYWYITADKLLDRAGGALADNGVSIVPAIIGYDVNGGQANSGAKSFVVTVNFMMTITDGETSMDIPWVGMGVDYSAVDKALYKAITSGHKYFLMKLLNVGAGNEDGEHESHPTGNGATQGGGGQDVGGNGNGGGEGTGTTTGQTKSVATAPARTQSAPASKAAPKSGPVNDNGQDISTGREVIKTWKSPIDAQNWSVKVGGEPSSGAAMGAWKKVLAQNYGAGASIGPKEIPTMFEKYYEHVMEKIRESAGMGKVEELAV